MSYSNYRPATTAVKAPIEGIVGITPYSGQGVELWAYRNGGWLLLERAELIGWARVSEDSIRRVELLACVQSDVITGEEWKAQYGDDSADLAFRFPHTNTDTGQHADHDEEN